MTATLVLPTLASIPSPSSSQIHLGSLRFTAYGLMIALGVLAAVEIARRRHRARGGDPDDFSQIGLWGVLGGMVGARLYHVATDLERFRGNWGDVVKIWEGGLGIPGGLLGGVVGGLLVARRRGLRASYALDIAAPALPVAQAIGRWGNWFNQELFGGPTNLPWALRIDPLHRPVGSPTAETYHPTFLYESVWNIGLAVFVIVAERRTRGRLRPGSLFAIYVAGYGIGRFWVESLRVDPAQELLGVRFNLLVAAFAAVAGLLWLALRARTLPAAPDRLQPEGTPGAGPGELDPHDGAGPALAEGLGQPDGVGGEVAGGSAAASTGSVDEAQDEGRARSH